MLRTIVPFLAGHMVFLLMLATGLGGEVRTLRSAARAPQAPWRALLVLTVLLPLLTVAAVVLIPMSSTVSGMLLLAASCAGAPLPSKDERALTGQLQLLVAIVSPTAVVLWCAALGRWLPGSFAFDLTDTLSALIPGVVIPLAVGLVIRELFPETARWMEAWSRRLFTIAFGTVITLSLLLEGSILLDLTANALLVVVLLLSGAALLGDWAGGPDTELRRYTARAAIGGNPALVMAIVAGAYPGVRAIALISAYVVCRFVASLPYRRWEQGEDEAQEMVPTR